MRGKTVAELSLAEWEATLRTNLTGPFNMVRAFLRHVPGGGPGKIVNVSSVHEEMPAWRVAEYSAAKGGLRNFTRCLALELAPRKINVNNVAPGTVLTQMVQELLDDPQASRSTKRRFRGVAPARRRTSPAPCSSSRATPPITSPARRSSSMAVCS